MPSLAATYSPLQHCEPIVPQNVLVGSSALVKSRPRPAPQRAMSRACSGGRETYVQGLARGEATRTAEVVRAGKGNEPAGAGSRGSAARPAGAPRFVPRVVGRAVGERFGGDAGRELGRVGLADEHEARVA